MHVVRFLQWRYDIQVRREPLLLKYNAMTLTLTAPHCAARVQLQLAREVQDNCKSCGIYIEQRLTIWNLPTYCMPAATMVGGEIRPRSSNVFFYSKVEKVEHIPVSGIDWCSLHCLVNSTYKSWLWSATFNCRLLDLYMYSCWCRYSCWYMQYDSYVINQDMRSSRVESLFWHTMQWLQPTPQWRRPTSPAAACTGSQR